MKQKLKQQNKRAYNERKRTKRIAQQATLRLTATKIYHYTKGYAVESILQEGFIALEGTRGNIMMKPATSFVWFTSKRTYPLTALPYVPMLPYTNLSNHLADPKPKINWDELSRVAGGLFRFEFSASDERVQQWKFSKFRTNNICNSKIKMLELIANKCGDDASSFFISANAMLLQNCKLQMLFSGGWVDLLNFSSDGTIEQLSSYTLDDVIDHCRDRLCA